MRTGGKVVKNVAGYDLGKLMCGSLGSLAFIGRVSLRLHPSLRPPRPSSSRRRPASVARRFSPRSSCRRAGRTPARSGRRALRGRRGGGEGAGGGDEAARRRQGGRRVGLGRVEGTAGGGARPGAFTPGELGAFLAPTPRRSSARPRGSPTFRTRPCRRCHSLCSGCRSGCAPGSTRLECSRDCRSRRPAVADDDCVHCGFCLPTCPTYLALERGDGLAARPDPADGGESRRDAVAQPDGDGHFDACLGCMACVTACPSGVQYDRLIESTRETVERRRDGRSATASCGELFQAAPLSAPDGACAAACTARPQAAVAGPPRSDDRDRTSLAVDRDAGTRYARGWRTRGRVGILTGCVQSVVFGTSMPRRLECSRQTATRSSRPRKAAAAPCPSTRAGVTRAARSPAGRSGARGRRDVIVNTSGCGSHLKELGHVLGDDPAWADRAAAFSARVRDLGEFLGSVEPRARRHPLNLRVAMQDSCHLRHAQRLPLSSRAVAAPDPGSHDVELAEQDICCGTPASTTSPAGGGT